MSRAIAVFHGRFGRATLYKLNRPFNTHAHREGHLIFHVGGSPAGVEVNGRLCPATSETIVAVSPWEPHNFLPSDLERGAVFLIFYVDSEWFATGGLARTLCFGTSVLSRSAGMDQQIRRATGVLSDVDKVSELDREMRSLIDACFEQSWRQAPEPVERKAIEGVTDFRVRKSIRLMEEAMTADLELDNVAREAGLSRPHFYKLFRSQTGLTPNLFLNTLLMERALEKLVHSDAPMAEIGFDLGFPSQSGFTKFFAANVGMAPTDYRRAAHVV